jgi:hypothetical protein
MKAEKQNLVDDLLDPAQATRREDTFLAGARVLRRRRWRRRAWQSFPAIALLAAAVAYSFHGGYKSQISNLRSQIPLPPAPVNTARGLSDEELLSLFPDTPVGLATMADGKKRLVFPRPEDEAKFVSRL